MIHVLEHSLIDSLKVIAVVIVLNIILSFFEEKLAKLLNKKNKFSPFVGASLGLIPQCGIGVVASDLYNKGRISRGTIVGLFLACSDEALPILLSDVNSIKYFLPTILIKFVIGFTVGYLVDFTFKSKNETCEVEHPHVGCCHHEIEEESKLKKHLFHPLFHSLKIFAYVFIINFIFGTIVHFVGENNIKEFLEGAKYLTPAITTLIGLIPNCASSVIICESFINGAIGFGSLIAGLCVNAGLGLIYLFKNKKNIKDNLVIISILLVTSIIVGYLISFIFGF